MLFLAVVVITPCYTVMLCFCCHYAVLNTAWCCGRHYAILWQSLYCAVLCCGSYAAFESLGEASCSPAAELIKVDYWKSGRGGEVRGVEEGGRAQEEEEEEEEVEAEEERVKGDRDPPLETKA